MYGILINKICASNILSKIHLYFPSRRQRNQNYLFYVLYIHKINVATCFACFFHCVSNSCWAVKLAMGRDCMHGRRFKQYPSDSTMDIWWRVKVGEESLCEKYELLPVYFFKVDEYSLWCRYEVHWFEKSDDGRIRVRSHEEGVGEEERSRETIVSFRVTMVGVGSLRILTSW